MNALEDQLDVVFPRGDPIQVDGHGCALVGLNQTALMSVPATDTKATTHTIDSRAVQRKGIPMALDGLILACDDAPTLSSDVCDGRFLIKVMRMFLNPSFHLSPLVGDKLLEPGVRDHLLPRPCVEKRGHMLL